jgi:hypothetical protein
MIRIVDSISYKCLGSKLQYKLDALSKTTSKIDRIAVLLADIKMPSPSSRCVNPFTIWT